MPFPVCFVYVRLLAIGTLMSESDWQVMSVDEAWAVDLRQAFTRRMIFTARRTW